MKIIRTITLIPLNLEKTKVCLVKRIAATPNNAKWSFPGESIQAGENNNQAAIRIIKNQLNCTVTDFKEFKKTETRVKMAVVKTQYMTGTMKGIIKLDTRKYSDAKWFDLNEELLTLEYAFDEKKIMTNLLKGFKIIEKTD